MYRYSVDLSDFCDELATRLSSPAGRSQAKAVMQAVAGLIVGSWKGADYSETTDGQKGPSICFPKGR